MGPLMAERREAGFRENEMCVTVGLGEKRNVRNSGKRNLYDGGGAPVSAPRPRLSGVVGSLQRIGSGRVM